MSRMCMNRFFMRQKGRRSRSPPQTDRPLHVSRGGERGKVIEVSSALDTVKRHVTHIFEKLGVRNRIQASQGLAT